MISRTFAALWAHKIRSALTMIGVAVCVLALTTTDGMLGHMHAERDQDAARFGGRVLLQPLGAGYPPIRSTLRAETAAAMLNRTDIIASESTPLLFIALEPPDNPMDVAGVIGLGLLPGRERAWLGTAQIASGRATLAGEGNDAVILGSQAARFYNVSAIGETIVLKGQRWRVVGILKASVPTTLGVVDNLVVMPLAQAQTVFGLEGWISAVLLTAKEGREEELARAMTEAYPALEVYTQKDIRRVLLKELDLPNKFLGIVSWTMFIVALLIIANIMSIAVREHTQEVEFIHSIGGARSSIFGYTVVEALMLSLGGGALGMLVAVPTTYLFGWTWILNWGEMLRVAGLTFSAGVLSSVYPAYHAARAYPEALRLEELRARLEQVSAAKQTLGQAYRQLARGREEERKRIARELHDQVIQSLLGLKFHLAEQVGVHAELQSEINATIETIRNLCADLRPPALDHLGLAAALRSYMQDFQTRTSLAVEWQLEDAVSLPEETALALFRVAQEALTNVWRHAHAQHIRVLLRSNHDSVALTIEDDGDGFVMPERLDALVEQGHFGLMSMRERVESVGGMLRVYSYIGHGTRVEVRVPLESRQVDR